MDFSKKGTLKKQQQLKSTTRKITSKVGVTLFRIFLISIVFTSIVGAFAGFGVLKGLADSSPSIDQINVAPTRYTTKIYDKDGNEIESLIGAEANREYVTIDKIPEVVRESFISIEDERFYYHEGIDIRGIFRAGMTVLEGGIENAEGASTITQQLLKNQVFAGGAEDNNFDRVIRKVQEQYLAIQLEKELDKDQILEYYLNNINLGAGTYGVQTASKRYFNKEVSELNLSEAAVIASIAKSPTRLNPITNPDNNKERRALVLENMRRLEFCSEEEYLEAVEDDVYSRIQAVNEEIDVTSYYSYFVDELIEQVLEDLQVEKGYTYTQAYTALYSGGLSIYTTLDSKIQGILDEEYTKEENFPKMGVDSFWELTYALSIKNKDGELTHYHTDDLANYTDRPRDFTGYFKTKEDALNLIAKFKEDVIGVGDTIDGEKTSIIIQPQSSVVIMDQTNGQVVALIGGRGEKTGNRTLNRATNTVRQPGSIFKILSTYLPALDSAGMTLASVIDDAPYMYPGTDKYVENWNGEKYEGLSTLRRAIYRSMNVVTVKTLAQVTPQIGFDYLKKLGFTTIVDSRTTETGRVLSDINLPMALGGITDGVSNLEITAAFAAIANKGVYTKPTFYTKVLDHDNKVILKAKQTTNQVMKESTAFLLTNAMEDVVKVGTGTLLQFKNSAMPVSGKTGTTSGDKDTWFAGYTPYYTATLWSGYDNNRGQTNKSYQKILWRTIMERIHEEKELEVVPFTIPDSVDTKKICTKSGKLAVDGLCDNYIGGSTVKVEYFAKGTIPTEKCDMHVKLTVCKESHKIANDYCPPSSLEEVVYLIKEETDKTDDTPYIKPTETCNVHAAGGSIIYDIPYYNNSISDYYSNNNYNSNNKNPNGNTNNSTDNNNNVNNFNTDEEFYYDYEQ